MGVWKVSSVFFSRLSLVLQDFDWTKFTMFELSWPYFKGLAPVPTPYYLKVNKSAVLIFADPRWNRQEIWTGVPYDFNGQTLDGVGDEERTYNILNPSESLFPLAPGQWKSGWTYRRVQFSVGMDVYISRINWKSQPYLKKVCDHMRYVNENLALASPIPESSPVVLSLGSRTDAEECVLMNEFYNGDNLSTVLAGYQKSGNASGIKDALAKVCDNFIALWKMGWAHNEANDGNILFGPDGKVKFIGAGFACEVGGKCPTSNWFEPKLWWEVKKKFKKVDFGTALTRDLHVLTEHFFKEAGQEQHVLQASDTREASQGALKTDTDASSGEAAGLDEEEDPQPRTDTAKVASDYAMVAEAIRFATTLKEYILAYPKGPGDFDKPDKPNEPVPLPSLPFPFNKMPQAVTAASLAWWPRDG